VLVEGLNDPDINVRACAAEWLGEHSGPSARTALEDRLDKRDQLLTLTALQSLNRMEARIPLTRLTPLLNDPLYDSELLAALGRSGEVDAAAIIGDRLEKYPAATQALNLLHTHSPQTAAAVEDLLQKTTPSVTASLLARVKAGNTAGQQAAVRCLLWTRRIEHLTEIIEVAQQETVFPLVLGELKRWGQPAKDALEAQLNRSEGAQLASAIRLFALLLNEEEGKNKNPLFNGLLSSENPLAVTAAAGALARFGDPVIISKLVDLLNSRDHRVQSTAGYALKEIGRRHPDQVWDQLRPLEIEGSRGIHLCHILETVGRPEDAPRLSAACSSPLPELRSAVLGALAAVGGANALDTVALGLTDEDTSVRMAASAALAHIGPAAAETIVSALRASTGALKASLVRSLGLVGHPEAMGILTRLCRGPSDVALAALSAMQQLDLDLGEITAEILLHPDPEVIKQALDMLGFKISTEELITLLNHDAWDVRLSAAERLHGQADDPVVRRALESRLETESNDLVQERLTATLEPGGKTGITT
jgi:HEAT repeat protein